MTNLDHPIDCPCTECKFARFMAMCAAPNFPDALRAPTGDRIRKPHQREKMYEIDDLTAWLEENGG